jgi:hypothetical protein
MVRLGLESRSFHDAIEDELSRTAAAHGGEQDRRGFVSPGGDYDYLGRGDYEIFLRHWFSVFQAADFLVLDLELFAERPSATWAYIQRFLDLREASAIDTWPTSNAGGRQESSLEGPVDRDYFDGANQRLRRLLLGNKVNLLRIPPWLSNSESA